MMRLKVLVVFLSACFISTEADVNLEVKSGLSKINTIECGKDNVIECVVSPFPGTGGYMAWNTDSKPLTQCYDASDDDCTSLSVDHYTFSSSLTDKTFNLTFNTVKLSDGSVEFRCTDTITTDTVTPNVAVMPTTATTTNSSSGLELEVTTGCVYPHTAIRFEWYYVDNGDRKVLITKSGDTEVSTGCATGDCGGADVKKITSTLTTDSGGEEYNIYVDVKHDAAPENDPNYVVTKSFGMFKVTIATTEEIYVCAGLGNSTIVDSEAECAGCWIVICLASLLVVLYLIGIVLGCILKYTTCCCVCFYESESCRKCANYECCFCGCCAPTPCGACCIIGGPPPWYIRLWASAIGIPIAFGIWVVWRFCGQGSTTTLSIVEGRKVTFSCPFPESVTFPEWRGPPGLTIYTSSDDTLGRINSKIPAFNRLQYASNKRDLILSDAVISDSGDYRCSYTGQGDHTITLKVNRANCTGGIDLADNGQLLQENPV